MKKMIIEMICNTCHSIKQSHWCSNCDSTTFSTEYVHNPTEQFIKGLRHEEDPFRYRIVLNGEVFRMDAHGQDERGYCLDLYSLNKTMIYHPNPSSNEDQPSKQKL